MIIVRSLLNSPVHFNSVSVGVAKNPAASQVVRPIAGVPALTYKDGASLSFVLLIPPAAPSSHARSQAPFFSVVRARSRAQIFSLVVHALPSSWFQSSSSVCSGAPVFRQVVHAFPGSWSQSALSRVRVHESGLLPSAGGYCFPAPKHGGSLPLPLIFPYVCAFTAPRFIPQAGDVRL